MVRAEHVVTIMSTAIRIEMLPARLGDCLLVECLPADGGPPWRMLVDGGPPDTWKATLRPRLERLAGDRSRLDLVIVTHIDSDHIGGMIPFFREKALGIEIGDVWFNGHVHLPAPGATREMRSPAQGEQFTAELLGEDDAPAFPWNDAFGCGPVETPDEGAFIEVPTAIGSPRLTLLSPTPKRLAILEPGWSTWLDRARGIGDEGDEPPPPPPPPLTDLRALAAAPSSVDPSKPNGSSIAVLVEHRGASCLLGADAFGSVLGGALIALAVHRGVSRLPVDAVKLPHHGSRNNISNGLMQTVTARHWLVSSNGDRFGHPDDIALARVVTNADPGSTLWFNYRNARTARWDDPELRAEHGYDVRYPDATGAGIVLELEERP